MICKQCKRSYTGLACEVCLARHSQLAYRALQRKFIDRVLTGSLELRLRRPGTTGRWHIELFGEPTHAYCHEPFVGGWRKQQLKYTEGIRPDLCPACLQVFDDCAERMEQSA